MPNKDFVDEKYLPEGEDEQRELLERFKKQITDHPVVKQYHDKWKELLAWTDEGDHFSECKNGRLAPVELNLRKRQVVVNFMKPLAEALESKINTDISIIGMPNSSELEDIEASQVATKFIAANDYSSELELVYEDFKFDLIHGPGNGFIKSTFESGVPAKVGKKKKDAGDNVHDIASFDQIDSKGDVLSVCPSVFNCRPDPAGTSRKRWRWFTEIQYVTKDEIISKFKVDEEELKDSTKDGTTESRKGSNEPVEDKCKEETDYVVTNYWERKSSQYPDGRLIIATGNLFLFAKANPALGEIPYWHTYYKRRGNSMWGTSPMHHVQGLNREINRSVSMQVEHNESWKPKIAIAPGAFKKGAFTTDAAEILEIDTTGGSIVNVPTPELSSAVPSIRDFFIGALDKVSNVHEVSYSQLPQYATRAPASLYSMMLEQEDNKIDPLIKRMNRMALDNARFRLRLMAKYYKEDRMVKIVGKNAKASVQYFSGADLKENYDVQLSKGVSIHQSKTIQQRLLLELFQAGVITDKNRMIKLLQMGDVEEELRGDIADEARATRENQAFINDTYKKKFEEGGVVVYLHDNHELHLDYHTNLAKSEEAQSWPKEKFADLNIHITQHFQMWMQLKQAASQAGSQPSQPGTAQGEQPGQPGMSAGDTIAGGGGAATPGTAPAGITPPTSAPAIPTPQVTQMRGLTATRKL